MAALSLGCTLGVPEQIDTTVLLSGETLFGEQVTVEPAQLSEILTLDKAMQDYVAASVGDIPYSGARLRELLQSMIDDGLLNLQYDSSISQSAIDTFYNRNGNCLSFSLLFVALAREAGLDASFQMVDIPPSFSATGELVQLNNHINVVINGIRNGPNELRRQVVDFNAPEFRGNYDTHPVDDSHVLALFHSNLAVNAISEGNYRVAFTHLKKGIEAEPGLAELWVNLGVLYSRQAHYDSAIQSYQQALILRPANRTALTNLASLYQHIGEEELAESYKLRVAMYQNSNPYYHFYQAREEYQLGNYHGSLANLDRAISIKKDEHQFYYLQGLNWLQLSEVDAARQSLEKARQVAEQVELEQAYDSKLEVLQLASNL